MDLTSYSRALQSLSRRVKDATIVTTAEQLQKLDFAETPAQELERSLTALIDFAQWEPKAAGFLACEHALTKENVHFSSTFKAHLCSVLEQDLEHTEPRLRTAVVSVLRRLATRDGSSTWKRFGPLLLDSVERNLVLDESERAQTMQDLIASEIGQSSPSPTPTPTPSSSQPVIFHETIGWKALETSMRGLQRVIEGYGEGFITDGNLTAQVISIATERTLTHENRYVREVGYDVCGGIVEELCKSSKGEANETIAIFAAAIKRGLTDNWSQVRYAASIAVRKLLLGLKEEAYEAYLEFLVPRMCLNRYYLAQGVKLYSQETWTKVFGERGVQVVADYSDQVIDFYASQCRADNHAVREAACYCIAELATKVRTEKIEARVAELLKALVDAFKDESWPVRDAACVASAKFVSGYPEACRATIDAELFKLWFDHLSDNIWSVREDSAIALGTVMKAYKDDKAVLDRVLAKIESDLDSVFKEKEMERPVKGSEKKGRASMPSGVVSGSMASLDDHSHEHKFSNQQLYSCGSLAPKLRRGVGCMDHGFSRAKKPWEETDGAVYLLRELAKVHPKEAEKFMPALAKVAEVYYFENYFALQETLWKQLFLIAKALGKRPFKRHMELFLPRLIKCLSEENQLVANSAADCINSLEKFLGKEIFKNRVLDLLTGDALWAEIEKHSQFIRYPTTAPFLA